MRSLLGATLLLLLASGTAIAAPNGPTPDADVTVSTFKTDVQPRIDPVFGGVAALRSAIDEFLALEGDMKKSRDSFSTAVHDAIAQIAPIGAAFGTGGASGAARGCPPDALASQRKARDSGRRFLALGRRFEARFREIRRGLSLGDTVGLTPDYRLKANRSRELYDELLRDYQEMRVAFHDQLLSELRHVGCKVELVGPTLVAPGPGGKITLPVTEPNAPDPDNPSDWALVAADEPLPPLSATSTSARNGKAAAAASAESSPAIWIGIDNTRCARPSSFTLDGRAVAPIPAGKKVQIRTRAGPHSLCVLPATEKRPCGATGTVRRAYLFEGWSMAVRCDSKPEAK
jgi:hypothetical protein